ncbi:hypothetical protein [Litorivivens sp.]|uniref:hypothetical protein n=1 Tax=Litorivivens sp. TaxID=2020868 RepID=UPI003564B8CB
MIQTKVAVATTFFPAAHPYLDDFLRSIASQSYSAFDLVILNDGYGPLDELAAAHPGVSIREVCHSETIAKNREVLLNFVKDQGYESVILADSDDHFDKNRVELSLQLLKRFDVVVNDIALFDDSGIYAENYFSQRIKNGSVLDLSFIREKNIFGMSNSAFSLHLMDVLTIPDDLVAVDWYIFSRLLRDSDTKAVFTSDTQTYYRQYRENTVGMKKLTRKSFLQGLDVKDRHYSALLNSDESYRAIRDSNRALMCKEVDQEYIEKLNSQIPHPLWWEAIK